MNRVIVSLYGGLGNQLFQYSAAKAYALKNNASLTLDLFWFQIVDQLKDTTPRKYALNPYKLNVNLSYIGLPWHQKKSFFDKLLYKVVNFSKFSQAGTPIYSENLQGYDENFFKKTSPIWFNGYWQSYKYFDFIDDIIKKDIGAIKNINNKSRIILNQIKSSESVCIHIRRGDYVTNTNAMNTHGVCSLEYYYKGLEKVCRGLNNPQIFIFSDDPLWVKSNFKSKFSFTIVDVNGYDDAYQDLWLMKSCQRFVIANSSLSWWAAWLSNSPKKLVVAPKKWFLSNKLDSSDLIPLDWIRL